MKILLPVSTLCLALSFFISSCGKDDNPAPAKTKTELITQSTWKFDKAMSGGFDVSAFVPACWKDNIAVFVNNGTGTLDESAVVCMPSVAGAFTWAFQSNETILHLSAPLFPGGSGDFTLISLTETNLVVSQNITIPPNPPTDVEFTFKH